MLRHSGQPEDSRLCKARDGRSYPAAAQSLLELRHEKCSSVHRVCQVRSIAKKREAENEQLDRRKNIMDEVIKFTCN